MSVVAVTPGEGSPWPDRTSPVLADVLGYYLPGDIYTVKARYSADHPHRNVVRVRGERVTFIPGMQPELTEGEGSY